MLLLNQTNTRERKVDKYPQAPQLQEPTVERLSNSVPLRRVGEREGETERKGEKEKEL